MCVSILIHTNTQTPFSAAVLSEEDSACVDACYVQVWKRVRMYKKIYMHAQTYLYK